MATEAKRGCGYRKVGGTYLVTAGFSAPCAGLPIPLERCPTCDAGIKPTRGFAWVDGRAMFAGHREKLLDCPRCGYMKPNFSGCVIRDPDMLNERDLLIWAGSRFYPTPHDFIMEAGRLGISSRVPGVPKGAEPGKTWLFAAHREVIVQPPANETDGSEDETFPGVIMVGRLRAIERIVTDRTPAEEIEKLEKQGVTAVVVPFEDKDHR